MIDIRIFYKQDQALEYRKSRDGLFVFSHEFDDKGRRRFLVSTIVDFWTHYGNSNNKHFYEVIPDSSQSKLYFDLEFSKPENEDKDGELMSRFLIQKVNEYLKVRYKLENTIKDVMVLDSSNISKYSCHLIFHKISFSQNKKIVNFLLDFESMLSNSEQKVFQVINKGRITSFVDKTVYSKNRNFRLLGSWKFGKFTPLILASFDVSTKSNSLSGDSKYQMFKDSLVTNVEEDCKLLDVGEVSEQAARGTNITSPQYHGSTNLPSPFYEVDEFVKSQLLPGGFIRSWNISYNDKILYSIGGRRFCANVKRDHTSNHIFIVCDLAKMTMTQHCHSCKGFQGAEILIPEAAMRWWHEEFGSG